MEIDLEGFKIKVINRIDRALDRYTPDKSKLWKSKVCRTVAELFDDYIAKINADKNRTYRNDILISKINKEANKAPIASASSEEISKKADEFRESNTNSNANSVAIVHNQDIVKLNKKK